MGEGTGESIQKTKKGIYNRTSVGGTRPGQEDVSRSRCIRLYDKRSAIDKI